MASEEQGESLRDRKTREFEEDQEQHEGGYCSGCGGYKPSQLDGDGLCYDCRKQQCQGCGKEFQPEELDGNGMCQKCSQIPRCQECGRASALDENGLCANCKEGKDKEDDKDKDKEDGENKEKDGDKDKNGQVGLAPEHASQIADGDSQDGKQGARYGQENYYDIEDESPEKKSIGSEQGDDEEEERENKKDAKNQEIAAEVDATQAGLNASDVTSDGGKGGQMCSECGQPSSTLTNGVCPMCIAQHQEEGTSTCPGCGNLLDKQGGPCPHCKTNNEDPNNALYRDPNENAAASSYKDDIGRDDQGNLVGTGLKADAVDGQNNAGSNDFTGGDQFGGGQHQNMGAGGGQEDGAEKSAGGDGGKGGKRGSGGIQNTKGQEADPKGGGKGGQDQGQPPPEGWFRWLELNWWKMVKDGKTKGLCTPINQAVHKGIIATAVGAAFVIYPGFNTDTVGALFNILNDFENPLIYTGLIFAGSNAVMPFFGPFLIGLPAVLAFSGMDAVELLRNAINHVLKLPPVNALLLNLKKVVDESKPEVDYTIVSVKITRKY